MRILNFSSSFFLFLLLLLVHITSASWESSDPDNCPIKGTVNCLQKAGKKLGKTFGRKKLFDANMACRNASQIKEEEEEEEEKSPPSWVNNQNRKGEIYMHL